MKDLELSGIPPSDVIYMAYGVDIIPSTSESLGGVLPNFTMCSGEELLETIETCTFTGVPDCKEPTVHGFLSAACNRKSTTSKLKLFVFLKFLLKQIQHNGSCDIAISEDSRLFLRLLLELGLKMVLCCCCCRGFFQLRFPPVTNVSFFPFLEEVSAM